MLIIFSHILKNVAISNNIMNKYFILSIFFISTLTFFSCEDINNVDTVYPNSILCRIEANKDLQECYIYKTASPDEFESLLKDDEPNHVSGDFFEYDALITLHENTTTSSFIFTKDTSYFTNIFYNHITNTMDTVVSSYIKQYYKNMTVAEPKQRYRINVKTTGEEMVGETTIPGDFEIITPVQKQKFTRKDSRIEVPLRWTASENTKGYEGVITFFTPSPYDRKFSYYFDTQDLSFTFSQTLSYYGIIDSCIITISAYDNNYYNFKERKTQNAGITNGYGYFGSAVSKTVKVIIE